MKIGHTKSYVEMVQYLRIIKLLLCMEYGVARYLVKGQKMNGTMSFIGTIILIGTNII